MKSKHNKRRVYSKVVYSLAPFSLVIGLSACAQEDGSAEAVDETSIASELVAEDLGEETADTVVDDMFEDFEDDTPVSAFCERARVVRFYKNKCSLDEEEHMSRDRGARHAKKRYRMNHRRMKGKHRVARRVLYSFDSDHDGALSEEELEAAAEAVQDCCEARVSYLLENYDSDEDGRLNRQERYQARQDRRQARQDRRQERRAQFLADYDEDQDGKLSREERQIARAARWEAIGIDPRDGLDPEEHEALKTHIKEKRENFCSPEAS